MPAQGGGNGHAGAAPGGGGGHMALTPGGRSKKNTPHVATRNSRRGRGRKGGRK